MSCAVCISARVVHDVVSDPAVGLGRLEKRKHSATRRGNALLRCGLEPLGISYYLIVHITNILLSTSRQDSTPQENRTSIHLSVVIEMRLASKGIEGSYMHIKNGSLGLIARVAS